MARLRKDDEVVVIAGKDKGARGKVLKVLVERDRVIVEGVNRVKRHTKPTPKSQGGIHRERNVDPRQQRDVARCQDRQADAHPLGSQRR